MWYLAAAIALYVFGIINKMRLYDESDDDHDGLTMTTMVILWPIEVIIIICAVVGTMGWLLLLETCKWLLKVAQKRLIKWHIMKEPTTSRLCHECGDVSETTSAAIPYICSGCEDAPPAEVVQPIEPPIAPTESDSSEETHE